MSDVYRARDTASGDDVAIKVFRNHREEPLFERCFERECLIGDRLQSPHAPRIRERGQDAHGAYYLVMDLLLGESLGQRLGRRGVLSTDETVTMALQVLRCLEQLHTLGFTHGDLKPENIFFGTHDGEEKVFVIDFGAASAPTPGPGAGPLPSDTPTIFGTPRYMPPEKIRGAGTDGRSDLYALCAILYHALCGQPPFAQEDAQVVLEHHLHAPPMPLRQRCAHPVSEDLEEAIMGGLAKAPEARPASCLDLADHLRQAHGHEKRPWYRRFVGSHKGSWPHRRRPFGTLPMRPAMRPAMRALVILLTLLVLGVATYGWFARAYVP
jgi:serine/threonine-protein kinase